MQGSQDCLIWVIEELEFPFTKMEKTAEKNKFKG